jgi:hypothetical protein
LNLLIRASDARRHFLSLRSSDSRFQLLVAQPIENMITKFKGTDERGFFAGVLIGDGAPISDMFLEQEVRISIISASVDSFRIVCEVDRTVLYS